MNCRHSFEKAAYGHANKRQLQEVDVLGDLKHNCIEVQPNALIGVFKLLADGQQGVVIVLGKKGPFVFFDLCMKLAMLVS